MPPDPYRTGEWAKYRREVIRLDGGACRRCGRREEDGVVLQVHHKEYLRGYRPWDYPYEMCETVCKGCHASEHGIIAPKFGWEYVTDDDADDVVLSCDYCGTPIRYFFIIQHPKWPTMQVGEICCDNLTSSQFASDIMESRRRYADRLRRFVSSPRWETLNDEVRRIKQQGFVVEIVLANEKHRLRINTVLGKAMFESEFDAKVKIFELIESGKIEEYFSKERRPTNKR